MKGHDVQDGVKMGTYEQNIGLKKFRASGAPDAAGSETERPND
jgi:hypothetical protein